MINLLKIIIISWTVVSLYGAKPSYAANDPSCPGFSCPGGKQCESAGVGAQGYICVDCPRGADGAPNCRTTPNNTNTDAETVIGEVLPPNPVDSSPNAVYNYIPTLLTGVYFFALILVLVYLVYGGVKWITSGGDPKALQAARDCIFQAIVGLILLSVSIPVARLFEGFLNSQKQAADYAAPGTQVYTYQCGYGPSRNIEWRNFCDNPASGPIDAASWNNTDPALRATKCTSTAMCNAGCRQNELDRQAGVRRGDPPGTEYYTRCR